MCEHCGCRGVPPIAELMEEHSALVSQAHFVRQELAAGTRLQESDLQLAPMELSDGVRARVFDTPQPLVGATLVAPLGAGELVQSSAVVARKGGTASRELSFVLERGRVGTGIKQGDGYSLMDTGSTNGTLLNGEKLPAHEERRLTHGDRIRVGERTEIIFE